MRLPVADGEMTVAQTAPSLEIESKPAGLDNPESPGGKTRPQTFEIVVAESWRNPRVPVPEKQRVTVTVYAPPGAVEPRSQTVPLGADGTARARFVYSGAYFANPMTVTATLGNGSATSALVPAHRRTCTYGDAPAHRVAQNEPLRIRRGGGFRLRISVAGGAERGVQLDTGSTGLIVSASALAKSNMGEMVGPGELGFETLHPSGKTFIGHYWLAPVTLIDPQTDRPIDRTIPMEVLSVEYVCTPGSPCVSQTSPATGHTSLMGIGFGRPDVRAAHMYLQMPQENVLLQLQDAIEGTLHSGYVLSNDHLWLGLNDEATKNFGPSSRIALAPYASRPGDWEGTHGCLRMNGGDWQCGSLLFDVGINSMIAGGFQTPSPLERVDVVAPDPSHPALSYGFPYPVPQDATPPAPNPNGLGFGRSIEWLGSRPVPFVNTGRNPIAVADYLFDSACGVVGFAMRRPSDDAPASR
jgi:hypothetical protein